jgi:CBS domain-containing protein
MRRVETMNVGRICKRQVATIAKNQSVLEAARRMRDEHVGDLVVIDEDGGRRLPIGILTDRDIVVGLLARDADQLCRLDVGDILTHELTTVKEEEDIEEVLMQMQRLGIRRMPVVDDAGELLGIITADDLLGVLSEDLASIVLLISKGRRREMAERP